MTATSAKIGYGTVFQTDYTSTSPTVWVTLAETRELALPPVSRDAIDSSHECAPDEWRTFITGLKNGGEISIEMNFIKAQYNTLLGELSTTVTYPRRIVYLDGSIFTFNARLLSLEAPISADGLLSSVAKFKIDGTPALSIT